ncbi:hypothetical protein GJ496_007603, partial [Pomphorhynchus laevis]
ITAATAYINTAVYPFSKVYSMYLNDHSLSSEYIPRRYNGFHRQWRQPYGSYRPWHGDMSIDSSPDSSSYLWGARKYANRQSVLRDRRRFPHIMDNTRRNYPTMQRSSIVFKRSTTPKQKIMYFICDMRRTILRRCECHLVDVSAVKVFAQYNSNYIKEN